MNSQLLNRLAIIEYNQLKNICPFIFKGIESRSKNIHLNDFHIHNDHLYIKDKTVNNNNKFIWQTVLYFKNGYNQNILLFYHLCKKYNLKMSL